MWYVKISLAIYLSLFCSSSVYAGETVKLPLHPVVYAIKNIKAGSLIRAEDISQKMLPQNFIPGKAVASALQVVGFKAAKSMPSQIIIMAQDIDFTAKLSPEEVKQAAHEIAVGRKKWHSRRDMVCFERSLCDRAPLVQKLYKK